MWVPTSHWGMGALTLYCMHFGVSSRRCKRRAVTTPYWGMESLTSHGKVLGRLLSTLCAESWKRRCGGQGKSVLSASCWALYRALLTSSVLVSTPLSSIPPSRVSGVPLLINRFSDEGLSFRT